MSDDRMFERNARAWLELGPTDAPDRVVESALLTIESTNQERDLRIPWRLPTMHPFARIALIAAIGIIAIGGAIYALGPSGLSVGHPTSPPPSLEGAWDVDFTRAEMLAAGIVDSGEDNPGNYGKFRLVLDAGRWQMTQVTDPKTNDSGTYTVSGATVSLSKANGEGPFVMAYTASESALTFGSGGPVTFRVKSWTRVTPAAIEGTWGTTFSHEEMLAAGIIDSGEDIVENYGTFTLSIHAGVVTTVHVAPTTKGGSTATYVVNGSTYTATVGSDTFSWTFTVTPTTLTFGGNGPVTLRAKAWTRIGP